MEKDKTTMIVFKLSFIFFLITLNVVSAYGQDCLEYFRTYTSRIDTAERNVYFEYDEPHELFNSRDFRLFTWIRNDEILDSVQCVPEYLRIAFVLEKDGTLSNIEVCPAFYFCNEGVDKAEESERIIKNVILIFESIKTTPLKLDGEEVTVAFVFPILYNID